jgi:hypothetical protein
MAKRRARRTGGHVLNRSDRNRIRSLSRSDVEVTFAGLKRFLSTSKWLGAGNRYSQNTIQRIWSDVNNGRIRYPKQLAQYIAASSVLHCADGWGYLGKSISCLLRGDPHRARHFAYYAELRAAMALLAGEGIGIFNNRHFVLTGPNSVSKLDTSKGTHQVVWESLNYWGMRPRSGDLFTTIIAPYGRTLNDWFAPIGGGAVLAPQAQVWFRQWGMDLRTFADDRDARNVSSYRPDGIPNAWYLDAASTLRFASDFWSLLQPSENSRFELIDTHILRIALESTFKGLTGKDAHSDRRAFLEWSSKIVDYQGFSVETATRWKRVLNRELLPNDPGLFSLSAQAPELLATSHLAILSRAALLLRVAAGSTAQLIQASGSSAEAVDFWWNGLGQARGIWDGDRSGEGLTDLWADIEPLLQEIEGFQTKYRSDEQTFFRLGNELGSTLVGLASCERVAIWGMTS